MKVNFQHEMNSFLGPASNIPQSMWLVARRFPIPAVECRGSATTLIFKNVLQYNQ